MERTAKLGLMALCVLMLGLAIYPSHADGAGSGGLLRAITPSVLVDTKLGVGGSATALGADTVRTYSVANKFGIPQDASAVLASVTALSATAGNNYISVAPDDGTTMPSNSVVRFDPETVPSSDTAAIDLANGRFRVRNRYGTTHVRITIVGYFTAIGASGPAAGGFVAISPARVLDTQTGVGTPPGQIPANSSRTFQVAGNSVPSSATAVFVSLGVSYLNSDGMVKLYPSDAPQPAVETMDYSNGGPDQDSTMVPLTSTGKLTLANSGSADIHAHVTIQGYISGNPNQGGGFVPTTISRIFDSGTGSARLGAGETRTFSVASSAAPPYIGAALLTVIARDYDGTGYVELLPSEADSLGYGAAHFNAGTEAGVDVSATALTRANGVGEVDVTNRSGQPVEVKINIQGWFSTGRPTAADSIETDPAPPTMTSYGVDQYELRDLISIADAENITLQQAVTRYGWQTSFNDRVEALAAAYPASFSSADASATQTTVRFKGTPPVAAAGYFSDLGHSVSVVGGATYSDIEAETMTNSVADAVASELDVDGQASVAWSDVGNSFSIEIVQPSSSTARTSASAIKASVENKAAQQNPSLTPPAVSVSYTDERVEDAVATVATANISARQSTTGTRERAASFMPGVAQGSAPPPLRGGVMLSWPLDATHITVCTSGFPVKNADDQAGLLTAGHCKNGAPTYDTSYIDADGNPHEGANRLELRKATGSTFGLGGDQQWHRGTTDVGHGFFTGVGQLSPLTGTVVPRKDTKVCAFGRMSLGYPKTETQSFSSCSTVTTGLHTVTITKESGGTVKVRYQREVKPGFIVKGDSGGPVYRGTRAAGIAASTTKSLRLSNFTGIRKANSGLGVTLKTQ